MMMTLVVIFGVCWLPYHIYFILSYTNPQINHSRYIQVGLLFTFTLVLFWASRAPLEQSYFPYYFRKSISQFTGWLCPIRCTTLWSTASWTIGESVLLIQRKQRGYVVREGGFAYYQSLDHGWKKTDKFIQWFYIVFLATSHNGLFWLQTAMTKVSKRSKPGKPTGPPCMKRQLRSGEMII